MGVGILIALMRPTPVQRYTTVGLEQYSEISSYQRFQDADSKAKQECPPNVGVDRHAMPLAFCIEKNVCDRGRASMQKSFEGGNCHRILVGRDMGDRVSEQTK